MIRQSGQRPTTRRWLSIAAVLLLAACAPEPTQTETAGQTSPGGVGGTGVSQVPSGVEGTDAVAEKPGGVGGTGVQGGGPDGVGGTGVVAGGPGGVGGTGIYGTITGFGSIIVNDLHIETPQGVPVRSVFGDQPPADLRIGQVVSVIADGDGPRLTARSIELDLAAVGRITAIDREAGTIDVLGQQVRVDAETRLGDPGNRDFGGLAGLRVGDTISVSGLHGDGYLQASRIDRRRGDAVVSLSGPVSRIEGDAVFIGNQRLDFADGRPAGLEVGRRARVVGVVSGNSLRAYQTDLRPTTPFAGRAKRLSIEGLVSRARSDQGFKVGGLRVGRESLGEGADIGRRAVVSGEITRDRSVRINRTRFIDRRGGRDRPGIQDNRRGRDQTSPRSSRRREASPEAAPQRDQRGGDLRRPNRRPGAEGERTRTRRNDQRQDGRQERCRPRDGATEGNRGNQRLLKRKPDRSGDLRRAAPQRQRGTDTRRTQRRQAVPNRGGDSRRIIRRRAPSGNSGRGGGRRGGNTR